MIHAFSFLIIEFHFKVSASKMGRLLIGSTAKAAAIMRNASPCFLHHAYNKKWDSFRFTLDAHEVTENV